MEANNQPSSSSSPICTQCLETKPVLKYVLPLSSGKKEFCSEPCLTLYRKESKSKKSDEIHHPIDETKPTKLEIEHALSNSTPSTTSEVTDSTDHKSAPTSSDRKSLSANENSALTIPPHAFIEDDSEFSWEPYLRETKSIAAPKSCFKQSSHPRNEFTIGSKLEAQDPRSQMACIATVISCQGPRLRLRLDGSDTKNDFWKMVDDSELHEIGHCEKMGGMLQPPMGFTLNATSWPKFLAKTLKDAVYCPSRIFVKEPSGPKVNKFQVGMKLEAVDKKNPHLICAATVGAIDAENIHISFDGWKGAFDYWTRFDSRDIFPCGWCSAANHPLQPPGQKACAGKAKINHSLSTLDNSTSSHCPSPRNTSNSRAASMSPRATSSPKQPLSPEKKHSRGDNDDTNRVTNSNISTSNSSSPSINPAPPVEVQIFVMPPASDACGPFLDYKKISQLPASFGPGTIHQVFRKSVQRLVDSALDQKEIFGLLRQGEGKVIITASFEDKMQNVRLPVVETETALWDFMEILFEELRCEMFYSKTKVEPRKREHSSDNELSMPDKKKKVQVNINKLKLQKKHKKEEKQSPLLQQLPQENESQSSGKACTSPGDGTPPSSNGGSKRVPIYHNAHKLHQAQRAARQFGKGESKQGNDTTIKPLTNLSNGDKHSTNNNTNSAPPLLTPVFSTIVNPKPSSPTMPILSAAMPFPKHPLPPSSLPESSLKNSLSLSLSSSSNNSNTPPILMANSLIKTVPPSNYNSQPPVLTPSQNTLPVNSAAGSYSTGTATSSLLQTAAPQSIVSLDTIVASTMAQQTIVTQSLRQQQPLRQPQPLQQLQQMNVNPNHQPTSLVQPSNIIQSYMIPNTGQQQLTPPVLQQQQLIQQQMQAPQAIQQQQHLQPPIIHQQQQRPTLQQYNPLPQPLLQGFNSQQPVHRQQQPPAPAAVVATAGASPILTVQSARNVQHVRPIEQSVAPMMVAKDQPIDASDWDIEETISKISSMDPTLSLHVDAFRVHEIDGKALLLLTSDMLMKYLGLKLGPALKICNIIDKLKGKKHLPVGL